MGRPGNEAIMCLPLWSFSYSTSQCPHMYLESSGYMGGLRGLIGYMSNPPGKREEGRRSKVGGERGRKREGGGRKGGEGRERRGGSGGKGNVLTSPSEWSAPSHRL